MLLVCDGHRPPLLKEGTLISLAPSSLIFTHGHGKDMGLILWRPGLES